jgi:hypothetical protein
VELEKQIEEGGLGGLEFSFPMILLEFLEIDPYGFIFDRVTAASITEEMPFLTEPIDKIFEKNVKAYEKYVAAVEKGEAPIVNIKLTDLTKELMEAEGIEGIEMQAYSVASLAGVESAEGIKYCMFLVNAGGMQMTMLIQQDGGCMMVEYLESLTVYIPVPGEEYDNVIFAISKGWNQYQFETYAPMIRGTIPKGKESSFVRNRNLFYVCCSRPKKRLFFFVSVPVDEVFRSFLKNLVGEENILTYSQYIERFG